MNQKQRDYLTNHVQKTFNAQVKVLNEKKPKKPSLNNYLIAAFLDNSIELQNVESLKKKIRDRVLKMGSSDILLEDGENWQHRTKNPYVKVHPQDLFVIPQAYREAFKKYKEAKSKIEEEIDTLEATLRTIEMKITLGSDKVLLTLVEQVDNMADLQLVNTQLMLNAAEKPKE